MSLLSLIREAATSISQPPPVSIVTNNTSAAALLWLTLARREGRELARRHDWQALVVRHSFAAVAAEAQPDALPAGYDHLVPDAEIWNRTSNVRYIGPAASNEWMQLHSGITGGPTAWWRIIGGQLNIYPAPTAGNTIELEYVSRNWCTSAAAVEQNTWLADSDLGRISEELMALGVTWRWLKSKGMDYAEDMATYDREVERACSRDRGIRPMAVGTSCSDFVPADAPDDVFVTP
jgi:hypothetical protein